jgi:phosphatidylglycerophosphate synthase
VFVLATGAVVAGQARVSWSFVAVVAALYAAQSLWLLRRPAAGEPGVTLGPADHVTLARSTLVLPLLALAFWPATGTQIVAWWTVLFAALALALDGVDGWVARRTNTASERGARYDMELDNVLLVALGLLVWRAGATGPWVLLIGGIRYLFVAAAHLWPALDGELPPSLRRKTICVIQGIALVICLAPITPANLTAPIAAAALALLIYSFAVDVRTLLRAAHGD